MINFGRVFPKAPGRLYRYENVSVHGARNHQLTVVFHDSTGSFPPVFFQLGLHLFFKGIVKGFVFPAGDFIGLLKLFCRKQGAVVGSMAGQYVYKFLCIFRDKIHLVSPLPHIGQQAADTFNGVKSHPAADIGIFRRIIVEDNSDFLFPVFFVTESRPFFCFGNDPDDPLRNGQVSDIPVFQHVLCCDGNPVDHPVKFRQGNRNGNLHGVHSFKGFLPFFISGKQRVCFQHRHVPLLKETQCQGAASRQGKFGNIDKRINDSHALTEEKFCKHLRQLRHSHFFIGDPIAEHTDGVHSLLFYFFNQTRLVSQISPYPFVPVKENAYRISSRATEIFFVLRQIRIHLFGPRMENAGPVDWIRLGNGICIPFRNAVHVQPEMV